MKMKIKTKPKKSALALAVVASMGLSTALLTETATAVQLSHVTDEVTGGTGGDPYHYEFTVYNDSFDDYGGGIIDIVVDWELPYFNDMGITNVLSPFGWKHEIETIGVANPDTGWDGVAAWNDPNDEWYQLLDGANNPIFDATQVLHWYCDDLAFGDGGEGGACLEFGIYPGGSLSGFSFDADFDAVAAPYQTSWAQLPLFTGDPAFPFPAGVGVGSPSATGRNFQGVPEPGTIALMSLGLAGFVGSAYRRKKKQANS